LKFLTSVSPNSVSATISDGSRFLARYFVKISARTSDIDVLIEFEPSRRVGLQFFAMELELSQILGRNVDLNTPGLLSRLFRDEVLKEAVTQYVAA
jgi:hypothetical protein